ncbi:Uncharacterised protein [uncultured archaeon]|nr:Uncharacterised protein [uncultured archaeon]
MKQNLYSKQIAFSTFWEKWKQVNFYEGLHEPAPFQELKNTLAAGWNAALDYSAQQDLSIRP